MKKIHKYIGFVIGLLLISGALLLLNRHLSKQRGQKDSYSLPVQSAKQTTVSQTCAPTESRQLSNSEKAALNYASIIANLPNGNLNPRCQAVEYEYSLLDIGYQPLASLLIKAKTQTGMGIVNAYNYSPFFQQINQLVRNVYVTDNPVDGFECTMCLAESNLLVSEKKLDFKSERLLLEDPLNLRENSSEQDLSKLKRMPIKWHKITDLTLLSNYAGMNLSSYEPKWPKPKKYQTPTGELSDSIVNDELAKGRIVLSGLVKCMTSHELIDFQKNYISDTASIYCLDELKKCDVPDQNYNIFILDEPQLLAMGHANCAISGYRLINVYLIACGPEIKPYENKHILMSVAPLSAWFASEASPMHTQPSADVNFLSELTPESLVPLAVNQLKVRIQER